MPESRKEKLNEIFKVGQETAQIVAERVKVQENNTKLMRKIINRLVEDRPDKDAIKNILHPKKP